MRILVINGSPRGKKGNTEQIIKNFLLGARAAGAETETVYLNEKRIAHCTGCFSCWTKTPGVCIHRDDMPELLLKLREADVHVYASPLYFFTVTGYMKDFMDRMLPLALPEIHSGEDRDGHPARYERKDPVKTVLISNCGFTNNNCFTGMVETFKVMTGNHLSAVILRTQGGMLAVPEARDLLAPYFSALQDAGRQFVEHGCILPETQVLLDADLMDPAAYIEGANQSW